MKYFFPLLLIGCLSTTAASQDAVKTGKLASAFTLEDLDGNSVSLKSVTGKGLVLINFWATWCKPCLEEMAEYQKTFAGYDAKGLTILSISMDSEKSIAKVKPLIKSKNYPFKVLLDTNSDVARQYYVQNPPFALLLDKSGRIVYSHLGFKKGDELEVQKKIDELLKN